MTPKRWRTSGLCSNKQGIRRAWLKTRALLCAAKRTGCSRRVVRRLRKECVDEKCCLLGLPRERRMRLWARERRLGTGTAVLKMKWADDSGTGTAHKGPLPHRRCPRCREPPPGVIPAGRRSRGVRARPPTPAYRGPPAPHRRLPSRDRRCLRSLGDAAGWWRNSPQAVALRRSEHTQGHQDREAASGCGGLIGRRRLRVSTSPFPAGSRSYDARWIRLHRMIPSFAGSVPFGRVRKLGHVATHCTRLIWFCQLSDSLALERKLPHCSASQVRFKLLTCCPTRH